MDRIVNFLIVWFFGGLGAVARYGVDLLCRHLGYTGGDWIGFSNMMINVPACFLIGIFAGILWHNTSSPGFRESFALASMTGFCGGFSTFSSYILDILRSVEQGRFNVWVIFGVLTVVLGLIFCLLGYALGKWLSLR